MKLKVDNIGFEDCSKAYEQFNIKIDREYQICAGSERNKGTCAGDSGGPLMLITNRKIYINGVVSFGTKPCAEAGVPGIYTNIWPYMNWINQNAL